MRPKMGLFSSQPALTWDQDAPDNEETLVIQPCMCSGPNNPYWCYAFYICGIENLIIAY